ncbi:MAG: 4-(cytidine 5'-diphospho)-2-C-methyl-D-erythritol kinase [Christensenellales bacterium]|jgi:4-diphosphocytidyl-2-C-methyl-D-erythritol kinase
MQIDAHAKINWHLSVLYKREDGYHELDMLMQQIKLSDSVYLQKSDDISLSLARSYSIPYSDKNIAYKAAMALKEYSGYSKGAKITLEKRIPVGAGLAGGSSNAAAVLHGLNKLWGLNLSYDTLAEIGLKLGADVPYCLHGGFVRAGGIGEKISPIPIDVQYWLVIIKPAKGLSTKNVFSNFVIKEDRIGSIENTAIALKNRDFVLLSQSAKNDLQEVCENMNADINSAIVALKNAGARHAIMTGAGSAVYGVFRNYKDAERAYKNLQKVYRFCYLSYTLV